MTRGLAEHEDYVELAREVLTLRVAFVVGLVLAALACGDELAVALPELPASVPTWRPRC